MVDSNQVFNSLKQGNEDIIKLRGEHEILKMHLYGTGTPNYLDEISGLENEDQIDLRRKFSGTNTSLVNSLLNPINKIFKAKGGSRIYGIENDDTRGNFELKLSNLKGYSLRQWLKLYWKDKLAVDPNGLFMIEKDGDGNPFMTYKSINRIFKYQNENQQLNWVIFEPVTVKFKSDIEKDIVRVIDEKNDYIFIVEERGLVEVTKENFEQLIPDINLNVINHFGVKPYTIEHGFDKVPAYIISDIPDTETGFKLSSISNEVQLLKEFLIDNSVKRVFKFLHGYPIFWRYFSVCVTCKGTGYIEDNNQSYKCSSCAGTGYSLKKDVSDVIGLRAPEKNDEPTVAPDVAGYVSPSIETWTKMTEELELLEKAINKSHWGVFDVNITPQTATGEVLRVQSQLDKLNNYSTSFENQEKFFTDLLGVFWYDSQYKGSSINLGKRYIIFDSNQILKEYQESKKNKADLIILNILLEQYFDGEFENDPVSLNKSINLMRVEPLVHYTLEEVLEMEVSEDLKKGKTYFNEWVMSKEESFFLNSYEEYKNDFDKFLNTISNGTEQTVQV